LTVKILLALFVFFIVSVLAGRSNLAVRFREREARWYNLALVATLLIVLMAGYMKMSPQPLKTKPGEDDSIARLETGESSADFHHGCARLNRPGKMAV
jgi:hypothetical protein